MSSALCARRTDRHHHLGVDDGAARVQYSPAAVARDLPRLDLTLKETAALSEAERGTLLALFQSSYRQANPAFLERSLERLRFAALAHQGESPVGFALAETTAMRANFVLPSETALNNATRSEQHDVDHETSSTLHPVKILPSEVSIAAPTL